MLPHPLERDARVGPVPPGRREGAKSSDSPEKTRGRPAWLQRARGSAPSRGEGGKPEEPIPWLWGSARPSASAIRG